MQRPPSFRKVGCIRKGCGQIAKVGYKRKEESGVQTQMSFYSKETLLSIAKDRGYMTKRALENGLASLLSTTPGIAGRRIKDGKFTKEECEVIGSFFEMSMREYYDTFMNGLFVIDSTGRYVCHVPDVKEHMNPPDEEDPLKAIRREDYRKKFAEEIKQFDIK